MIARRKLKKRPGQRQQFAYSPMIWINDPSGRHQLWGGTFRTHADAKAAERKLIQDRDAGADLRPSKTTLDQVFDQYLAEKRGKVKASTLQRSGELLALLRPLIGATLVVKLKPVDISKAYKELEQKLSKRTVRHCHWQLHGALDLAVRWGQVGTNVAGRVDPPEPDHFEGRALSQTEVHDLIEATIDHPMAPLIITAIDSGSREGELLALRWADIDMDAGVIQIARSVRATKGGFVFSEPKTKRSRRAVEVSAPTLAVLKNHRQRQLELRLKAGELWQDNDLVFPTDLGAPQTGTTISRAFAKIATNAGLEGLRFHDLRHSSLTLLLKSGESMADVSRRAGHSGIGTTVDTYGHGLGLGGSLAKTMGQILEKPIMNRTRWLANG